MSFDLSPLVGGVRSGNRALLSRAITLAESGRADHRARALELVRELTGNRDPAAPQSVRVGISGVPGVGKSTFIERLGGQLVAAGHRVGVLAVDPSSSRTRGSVLGDRTRMPTLSANPAAYVRPSPTSGTLGGVTRATAQTIDIVESAGYDVILVETVGVGQSEISVAGMVDTFLFLGLARTGDQLQGIKKGVLEIADVIAINKADSDRVVEAQAAAKELTGALRLVFGRHGVGGDGWVPPVLTCSGLTGDGVDVVWQSVLDHRDSLGDKGLTWRRAGQQLDIALALVDDELRRRLAISPAVRAVRQQIRAATLAGELSAVEAADRIIEAFDSPS